MKVWDIILYKFQYSNFASIEVMEAKGGIYKCEFITSIKGEVSPNNNVDWVSRKQFYKPNSKSLSRFG